MLKILYEADKNRVAAYKDSIELGEATYKKSGDFWILDHTFVDPNYRGQKIASKLVAKLVNQARINNIKVVPLCPYVKKEFKEKPEYHDILK